MHEFTGIFDIHAHASPDPAGRRSIDVLELAKLYRDHGFRGFLHMGHFDPTATTAYLAKKMVPEIEIYGGIVLNTLVGGMNPHAVRHFANIDGHLGKIVYMPTTDSENEVTQGGAKRPFVSVSKGGKLLPEVLDMLDLIAQLDLALSTGHTSPEEILLLIQAARDRGISRILVTNPHYPAISMSMTDMKSAAEMGAYLELIYYCVGMPNTSLTMDDYADTVKTIGANHCILSSCGGQSWMPIHTHAWRELLRGLGECGIDESSIDTMCKRNPALLLDIEVENG